MKKLIAVVLVSCVLGALWAGCAGPTPTAKPTLTPTPAAKPTPTQTPIPTPTPTPTQTQPPTTFKWPAMFVVSTPDMGSGGHSQAVAWASAMEKSTGMMVRVTPGLTIPERTQKMIRGEFNTIAVSQDDIEAYCTGVLGCGPGEGPDSSSVGISGHALWLGGERRLQDQNHL